MINIIKPGYTLFITSSQGDQEYFNTEAVTGLTFAQAALVEKFAKLCVSGYKFPDRSIYSKDCGNLDMDRVLRHFSEEDLNLLFRAIWPECTLDSWETDQVEGALRDLIHEIFGTFTEYYMAQFEFLKVAYFESSQVLQDSVGLTYHVL